MYSIVNVVREGSTKPKKFSDLEKGDFFTRPGQHNSLYIVAKQNPHNRCGIYYGSAICLTSIGCSYTDCVDDTLLQGGVVRVDVTITVDGETK